MFKLSTNPVWGAEKVTVCCYHSRSGLEIVGIVKVIAPAHPDSSTDDPRWDCVDVRALRPFAEPVSMQTIKADPRLADMVLVKNSRLSVQPVTDAEWRLICELVNGKTHTLFSQ